MRIVKLIQLIPYRFFYLLGLAVFTIGMPFNNLLMSQGLFYIAGTWLLSGIAYNNIIAKIKAYAANKQALALASIYLLLIAGMLYTTNYSWGLKDLRVKLPLFLLPFIVIGLGRLKQREYIGLLMLFVVAVFASTVLGYLNLKYSPNAIYEPRALSPFISHIRLSLLIIMALFTSGWLATKQRKWWFILLKVGIGLWLLYFMYMLESFTGFGILMGAAVVVLTINLYRVKNKIIKFALPLLLLITAIATAAYSYATYIDYFTIRNYQKPVTFGLTAQGNPYDNLDVPEFIENGNYVWAYVCHKELVEEWSKKSTFVLDSADAKGQPLYYTLLRYMTSKNLHKDAEGFKKLTTADIKAVEQGVANAGYMKSQGLKSRLHKVFWEYQVYHIYKNPSGHSVFMRWEFWRTAWAIIRDSPIIGAGTGDVPDAFAAKYEERKTHLYAEWRLRSHNQYLSIGVALGFVGILVFLFSMLYPFISTKGYTSVLFTIFFVTAALSMLTEDTLETQAGVSFYIFFFSLFLFLRPLPEEKGVIPLPLK